MAKSLKKLHEAHPAQIWETELWVKIPDGILK